ncbi:MAG: D-glycero-beta-D-manno-heptose 1-phosphate adenylyltransferase, partial [Gammaproteobacteria bacterium]|nr:D-glycero-beta-D-manno-heptose 1-phosphate adenylyltransferase [Gammaproteobacteria bacterium]
TVIPTFAQEVFDVSGAGDTAIATLACAVAAGASLVEAAELANLAAGIAVSKLGTATVFNDDLRQLASGQPGFARKVVSGTRLMTMLEGWRETGLSVGFTNGCFDLLHPGHVSLLHRARGMCDRLIVGLNADASVKRLKGEGRPLQDEASRAIVLASLADVDAVILFTEDTPLALIEAVRPNILFKGADYTVDTVVGADAVQKTGGRVELIPLEPNQSTTAIVDRISAD